MYARGATPLEALHRGMASTLSLDTEPGTTRRDVRRGAGDDPCDVRPVERLLPVERCAARTGAGEAAGHDHLRVVDPRPLREPRRIREAGRVEKRMLVVDAVVDDRDLDAGPARARQPRELGRAYEGGARFSDGL